MSRSRSLRAWRTDVRSYRSSTGADERAAVGREPRTDIVLVLSEFHLPQTHHLFPSPPLTPPSRSKITGGGAWRRTTTSCWVRSGRWMRYDPAYCASAPPTSVSLQSVTCGTVSWWLYLRRHVQLPQSANLDTVIPYVHVAHYSHFHRLIACGKRITSRHKDHDANLSV